MPGRPAAALAAALLLQTASAGAAPRLAVLIVVDQMRADYLQRFDPYFGPDGFKRLEAEGRVFSAARYANAVTETCVDHAVLGSGVYPSTSGIVSNTWFDRASGRTVYCTDDAELGPSSRLFEGPSMAGRLKKRDPRSRAIGISLKDRSAIMPAGVGADGAYWLEERGFSSSKAYPARPALDAYKVEIDSYLAAHPVWDYGLSAASASVCGLDVPERHDSPGSLGRTFPHPVKTWKDLKLSPGGNELEAGFARRAVAALDLGGREPPDLLTVSFSAIDYIGHAYGPDSCEMADAMARLDRDLAGLLSFLDHKVGREHLLVALSADHGVAPLPEVSARRGEAAGRLHLYVPSSGTIAGLPPELAELEAAAAARFGYRLSADEPASDGLIAYVSAPWLWLRPESLKRRGLDAGAVRAWLKERLGRLRGIETVYADEDLSSGRAPESVRRSWRADRSGDLFFVLKPYWIVSEDSDAGTDHGSLHDYDARVPLILWGGGVPPGAVSQEVSTASLAPTLAGLLGLGGEGFSEGPLPGFENSRKK